MKIMIQKDYLIFPVNTRMTEKTISVSHEKEIAFQLKIRLDNTNPDFYAYIDVSLFKGEFLDISVEPEMPVCFSESDEIPKPDRHRESVRPQVHYTVRNGWMGAPAALFRSNGTYVMLYPCDPADTQAENSLWGRAVSPDLIHWEEVKAPIVPENGGGHLRKAARACAEETENLYSLARVGKKDLVALTDPNGDCKCVSFTETGGYLVGDRKDGAFLPTQPEKKLRYGVSEAKGVTFADTETGRVIRMEWDSCRTARFCGQMSIPMELYLEKREEEYTLLATPVRELEALYKSTNTYRNLQLSPKKEKEIPLADTAQVIRICSESAKTGMLSAVLFGREIRLDFENHSIWLGDMAVPCSISDQKTDLTLIVDRCGMELFADGGRVYASRLAEDIFMDRNLLKLILSADMEYCIDMLEIHSLESIL